MLVGNARLGLASLRHGAGDGDAVVRAEVVADGHAAAVDRAVIVARREKLHVDMRVGAVVDRYVAICKRAERHEGSDCGA